MVVLGVVANAVALALLHISWRRKRGGVLMLLAWLCLAGALMIVAFLRGEVGVAECVLLFATLAASYFGWLLLRWPYAATVAPARPAPAPAGLGRRAALFAMSALGATIAALALCAIGFALSWRANWTQPDAIVTAVLVASVVWPILFCWLLMEESAARRLSVVGGLCLLGASVFALT